MPGMDGVETLRALRERGDLPETTAVVALTANAVAGAREEYLRAGFRDYLSKPIETDELEQMLARHLPENKFRWRDASNTETGSRTAAQPDTETRSETENPLEALSAAGFRTEEGLRYAAGDMDFYLELLNVFATEQEAKSDAIRDDVRRGDWRGYEVHVHALKSGARMIGADVLSGMAFAQENAAKNGDDITVKSGCVPLLNRYRETAETVRRALGGASGAAARTVENDAQPVNETPEVTQEEFRALLEEALNCLESFEVERAEQILKTCGGGFFRGQSLRSLLSGAIAALEEFETEKASDTLHALLDEL